MYKNHLTKHSINPPTPPWISSKRVRYEVGNVGVEYESGYICNNKGMYSI
ncbi:hypothetical protein GCM10010129_81530 [Streptomyces fumigatiscleroticus]|nr:hypothetical protein GCM10010129_81530 [Streptomyces fumigatiscleroticus]